MRPVSTDSDGPAPPESLSCSRPLVGSLPASEMSLLQSLGPVQNWLGQELEKCGIDAMIYTRYVLSLLLHDSYDYDLQDQENDIFLGWEKGAGKKWGKGKKKGGTDLSLEEMKKQAAVQCLRSASDENSGIESLVEELCSRLKDIQDKQKEDKPIRKKSDGCPSPERAASPSSKDQVEMYYEAFPPLSEKPVCLQEIMTVWNKAKACAYSTSSSSAAPQTSTDTSSPKDCNSDGEAAKEQHPPSGGGVASVTGDRGLQRRSKKEKENQQHGCAAAERKASAHPKRPSRHRPEGKYRARSWSSGSSEAGSSSGGNQGDAKASRSRTLRVRHRSREAAKSKRTRNSGQAKAADREERRHAGGSGGGSSTGGGLAKAPALYKKGKRLLKEIQKDPGWKDAKEATLLEALKKKEYMEEPLWYTEPIADYFVPFSGRQSKLETKYRSAADLPRGLALPAQVEALPEEIQGVCVASEGRQRAYLAAGSFVDGHFVEGPGEDEAPEPSAASGLPPPEGSRDLDDEHLSEFTHFYEVDIYRSMLDTSASESVQESRILSMIRQKSREQRDAQADCPPASDGLEQRGKSAIRPESADGAGSLGFLMEDLESMAQVWGCCSPSTSEDIDGESLVGDSPVRLSPLLDSVSFALSAISGYVEEPAAAAEASSQAYAVNASCFSLFELQYDSPTFSFPREPPAAAHDHADCLHPLSNKQSRLLIWTKNSAFEEAEHCSNLSTRTCSPWSHSEETRSDNEQQANVQAEDPAQVDRVIPPLSAAYLEDEILDFLQGSAVHKCEEASGSAASGEAFAKKSKLESVCGIALEEDESERYGGTAAVAAAFPDDRSPRSHDYSSGIIKDIWTAIGQDEAARQGEGPFPDEPGAAYCCSCLEVQATGQQVPAPQTKAVQRSEYHLWDSKKEEQDLAKNQASSLDGAGDYTTPSKPWDLTPDREGTSFLLGGVYGELKTLGGDKSWAVLPPGHAQSSLLQCAASDVLTIAGGCFAPGHRPLWRPLVSFGQSEQAVREGADGPNKGFSFIFREDLLGPYGRLRGEEPGLDYPFASFSLNNPFSQVLHVECSFESEDVASFSPGFKPRSILCSEPEDEAFHPRIYGLNRTQYRAIRISPRTHFRPISASELSPGGASDSEAETDKEEAAFPALAPADVFDDPQADLKPLEEDAECEGPYYGKSELESGKFLPRLKKSGMEKSAQTSLDSQEGTGGLQEAGAAAEPRTDAAPGQKPAGAGPRHGMASDWVGMAPEFPLSDGGGRGGAFSEPGPGWWQSTLGSPLCPGSQCPGSSHI